MQENNETFDACHKILQLYIVDIRSIGNAMLVGHEDAFIRPMTVDLFLQKFDPLPPADSLTANSTIESMEREVGPSSLLTSLTSFNDAGGRPMTATTRARVEAQKEAITKEALALEQEKASFNKIMDPLRKHIIQLTDMDPSIVPVRRLAIFQVLLCKLIAILDDANPWDSGPKFDQNEEPRYIQRDVRLTPAVKLLSNVQKDFLRTQVFFQDDSSFSFPGFREDLKVKSQSERDDLLWPGACPPLEPKKRPSYFKKDKAVMHTQGMALTSAVRRKMTQPAIVTVKALGDGGEGGQHSPAKSSLGKSIVGLFSSRHAIKAGNKVHPSSSVPRSAMHINHNDRASKDRVVKESSRARFSNDVKEEDVSGPGPAPVVMQGRPLSTIHSVPDDSEFDLEGGRDLDIPGQVRGSAALTEPETEKKGM